MRNSLNGPLTLVDVTSHRISSYAPLHAELVTVLDSITLTSCQGLNSDQLHIRQVPNYRHSVCFKADLPSDLTFPTTQYDHLTGTSTFYVLRLVSQVLNPLDHIEVTEMRVILQQARNFLIFHQARHDASQHRFLHVTLPRRHIKVDPSEDSINNVFFGSHNERVATHNIAER